MVFRLHVKLDVKLRNIKSVNDASTNDDTILHCIIIIDIYSNGSVLLPPRPCAQRKSDRIAKNDV